MEEKENIIIKGANVNNLKAVDLEIPRNKFIVITGVSGSGKTSLAFDTLFAEGQRRFAESLSSFARQFLGRMSKPAVDDISGIPPAIAIEQKVNTRNPRSTVGTTTELYDYLRLLFAKIGKTYSPISGKLVECDTANSVISYLHKLKDAAVIYILADIKWEDNQRRIENLINLQQEGYSRVFIHNDSGDVIRIDKLLPEIEKYNDFNISLLIDRITLAWDDDTLTRTIDSINNAFNIGNGHISVYGESKLKEFSNLFELDGITFEQPQEWIFNYNNPIGACKTCGGYGKIIGIDESLVIPNPTLSIYEDAIACWRGEVMKYFKEEIILNAAKYNIPIHKPYSELTKEQKNIIWKGNIDITGINPFFKELEAKKYKIQNRYMISRYSGKTLCPDCDGSRLRPEALYVKIGTKNIAELMDMPIKELSLFFDNLILDEYETKIAAKAIKEIKHRCKYIQDVGLSYLTLSRHSNTLSGGESQRINLVTSLGNSLTGSMYILDEPSIGLHSRDTKRLISVLKNLRDLGNTVIVVEHDEEIIRASDYLIDIGPNAGIYGGEIVYCGPAPKLGDIIPAADLSKSLTLQYLSGQKSIAIPPKRKIGKSYIEIRGAMENNLKDINVKFPLGVITAVIGVSGSGKSTLVGDILYPAIYRHLTGFGEKPGLFRELTGDLNKIATIEYVDQNPIGKSSRSNPATFLKIYDDIRKLYSDQPYAKACGFGHSHFSFNIDGGRCPECLGEGTIKIPMQFMADIVMTCEVCGGKRFKPEILEVKYQGKDICDILNMSVDEAYDFFSIQKEPQAKKIADKLIPLKNVGLNYIKLGQSSSTLSGGESQRVKLASFLGKDSSSKNKFPILFIFDEPTTGLHFDDIQKLITAFNALVDKGNSIIVVEHNPYIIEAADYIVELGPEGGKEGGYLISEQ